MKGVYWFLRETRERNMRTGKPSKTALKVATITVALGAKPEADKILPAGLLDATEKLLLASGVLGEKAVRWTKTQRMVSVYEAFDWMLPGQFQAIGERKTFCERQVRDAISDGAIQILVLGAGFDTLGWRLAPEFSHVKFFEIDHPATAHPKAEGIIAMGQRDNLFLIPEDLGKRNLVDTLATNKSWSCDAKSIIVAEGLLMYLPADAVTGLFSQSAAASGEGSRVIFTYIPAGTDGRLDAGKWTGFVLWLQKIAGEPWIWSIQPKNLTSFLSELGWKNDLVLAGKTGKHGAEFFAVATK
jgi:methyltransferase (TIGR00027 family)